MEINNKTDDDNKKQLETTFKNLKPWMTYSEINNYRQRDSKPGIILSMILTRYQQNKDLVTALKYLNN